jgi:hypothetical protein
LWALLTGAVLLASPEVEAATTTGRLGRVTTTFVGGAGVSTAPGHGGSLVRRSPASLTADVAFRHPEFQWLEFSPAIVLELEGRVGVGFGMRLRAYFPVHESLDLYAVTGLLGYVAPYTLLGGQVGLGMAYPLHPRFAFVIENSVQAFFAGNDLTDAKVLSKVDFYGGFRVRY